MKKTKKLTARDRRLRLLFRITEAEWEEILKFQKASPGFSLLLGNRLGVDHDHTSGLCRGLLEWRLNRALGFIEAAVQDKKKVPAVLQALASYYQFPPATTVLGAPRYGLIGKAQRKRRMIYGPPQESK